MTKEDPSNCPFCGMFERGEPVSMVWEDDQVAVFVVLRPVNLGNVVVVPKRHLSYLATSTMSWRHILCSSPNA